MNNEQSGILRLLKRRMVSASNYSRQGLLSCFKHEEAFRVEVVLAAVLIPLALIVADTPVELILLVGSVLLVLMVELLNSAVEAVVDRIGEDHHELSGRAKNQGSAAVMLSLGLALIAWLIIGFS
ncbi:MAG: diacylglycerol kinase (ATP) [Porticoccus sp.]